MSQTLEQRVESLEDELLSLRAELGQLKMGRSMTHAPSSPHPVESGGPAASSDPERAEFLELDLEGVITKIGVALVLLGIAFLLKYSFDQGWLTESMRVVMGFVGGTALLGVGLHQRDVNTKFAAALMGAAVAAYYGSIFAAHNLYELVGWTVALPAMIGTTMLGFVLAIRQKTPALSCIAAVGGFATPFLLDGADGASMLEIYTLVLLAGATAVYLMHGWRSLLVTMAVGSILVLMPAASTAGDAGAVEFVIVAVVIFAMVAAVAIVPAVRASLEEGGDLGPVERILAFVNPLAAVGLLQVAADSTVLTAISTGALAALVFAFHSLSRARTKTFLALAAGLAATATLTVLGVPPMAAAFASLGLASHWLAGEEDEGWLRVFGYAAMVPLGMWTLVLLFDNAVGAPFVDGDGLQMLIATAVVLGVAWTYGDAKLRWGHCYVATAAALAALAHQFAVYGDGFGTAAWGLLAVALLVAGFTREARNLQWLGVAVITLTAGKLLVVDLDTVATIWRVALFVTFGSAMLAISYWRGAPTTRDVPLT